MLPIGATIKTFHPTECGYNVEEDITNRQGYHGSRRAQAYNIPMLYAEYFRHGIGRTYLFALHNADGYGLLESDAITKRPSWYAVQSMVALLSDSVWDSNALAWKGGREFQPRALRFKMQNAPETVHTLTLQKEKGDWYLLIWNEIQNFRDGRDINNPAVPVRLKFETPVKLNALYAQGDIPDDVYGTPDGAKKGAFAKVETLPSMSENILDIPIPSRVIILHLSPEDKILGAPPAAPVSIEGKASENAVNITVKLPTEHNAVSVLLFRNDMHIATLDAHGDLTYKDASAWVRPGLGYRYAAQTMAADGSLSARVESVIVTPNRRPDLVVGTFGPDLPEGVKIRPGDQIRFKGTVRNIGDGAIPNPTPPNVGMYNSAVAITFAVNGKIISWGGDGGQNPMAPGEEREHIATGGPGGAHLDCSRR